MVRHWAQVRSRRRTGQPNLTAQHCRAKIYGQYQWQRFFFPLQQRRSPSAGNPDKPDFKVRDLDFYRGLDLQRLDRRREVVAALDQFSRAKDAAANGSSDPDLQRAYNLIASTDAKQAFKLSDEPDDVRSRYGRGAGNSIGQSCLLARRLVQRGVPFVTVFNNGWDTHKDIASLKFTLSR